MGLQHQGRVWCGRNARVTKTWAGWMKERFTRADNYVVQIHRPVEDPLRSLAIAAALAIDTALTQGYQASGSSLLGARRYESPASSRGDGHRTSFRRVKAPG